MIPEARLAMFRFWLMTKCMPRHPETEVIPLIFSRKPTMSLLQNLGMSVQRLRMLVLYKILQQSWTLY